MVTLDSHSQDTSKTVLYPTPLLSFDPNKAVNADQNPGLAFFMPIIHKHTYGEIRFNYDANNTAGLFMGMIWTWKKRKFERTLIPQVGLLIGEFTGISLQMAYKLSSKRVDFDFQNFYDISINNKENFNFNWSSVQYKLSKHFSGGLSSQTTLSRSISKIDGGYFIGFQRKNWALFIFNFNFYKPAEQYFYFGFQIKV